MPTSFFSLLGLFLMRNEKKGKKTKKISQLLKRPWVAKVATITCNKFNCQVSCY